MVRREQPASGRRGVRLHQRRRRTSSCHQLAHSGQEQHAYGSHLESRSSHGLYLGSFGKTLLCPASICAKKCKVRVRVRDDTETSCSIL